MQSVFGGPRAQVVASERSGGRPGAQGVRSIPTVLTVPADARFMLLERIEYRPEHDDSQMRAYQAMTRRSGPASTTWRDDSDRRTALDTFAPVDVATHRETGVVAIVGFAGIGSHADESEFLGGEFLWVRPPGETTFFRVDVLGGELDEHARASSVDVSPDGTLVAGYWRMGQHGAVCATVDPETLQISTLRTFTRDEAMLGGAEVRFSPDGSSVLVTNPFDGRLIVLDVETGRAATATRPGIHAASWWPQRGNSTLLVARLDGASTVLGTLDLATDSYAELGRLALPSDVREDDRWPRGLFGFSVAEDGRSLVGLSAAAREDELDMAQPCRPRLLCAEIAAAPVGNVAATATRVEPAFLDRYGAAAVEHISPRWLERPTGGPVSVTPALLTDPELPGDTRVAR